MTFSGNADPVPRMPAIFMLFLDGRCVWSQDWDIAKDMEDTFPHLNFGPG
jgi:hypothetical protein